MAGYADIRKKQAELIRKPLDGSAFLGAVTLAAPTTLTTGAGILTTLPVGMEDLGWLTSDGVQSSSSLNTAEVASWGAVTPTRTDIISETSTVTVVCQETKLQTLSLFTSVAASAITAAATTKEVDIKKPLRPSSKTYRLLTLAVDEGDGGEIYIARFFPRAKVTGKADFNMGGDAPLQYGVTFTGEEDSTLGYSERWLFGGPGWISLAIKMGWT